MRQRRLIFRAAFLAAVFTVFGISASAGPLQRKLAAESTIEQIARRGVIRVGMDTFVPWAMKNKKGELIGFEIDVAKQLAHDMGVKIEFVPTKWSGIIPALITGKFDVIIGGMTITPKRNLKINFTRPYYYTGQTLLAYKKLAAGAKSWRDFNRPGVTIAARLGATGAVACKRFLPKAKLRLFDDEPSALQELRNGRVNAFVTSAPLPAFMALDYPETLVAFNEIIMKEAIGFGVRKSDPDTLNYFNNWIETQKNSGFLQRRYKYWFTSRDWKSQIE